MADRRTSKIETRLAETRDRIVQSAIALIATNEYKATSMDGIAANAGISTGLLCRYFSSKSDIFRISSRKQLGREEIPPLAAEVVASAMVGAVVESLASPFSTVSDRNEEHRVVGALAHLCLQAAGYRDDASGGQ